MTWTSTIEWKANCEVDITWFPVDKQVGYLASLKNNNIYSKKACVFFFCFTVVGGIVCHHSDLRKKYITVFHQRFTVNLPS